MEIKRLLGRKVIFAGVLLYLLQTVLFIGLQIDGSGFEEWWRQNRRYDQLVETYGQSSVEESLSAAEALLSEERNAVTLALAEKLDYLAGYGDSIQSIFDNVETITRFSIFQDPNSFSYANTIKTGRDFERMRGIELTLDRDRATAHVLEYTLLSPCVFAFLVYVLYEILRERDNGMWETTHAMRNGRSRLAFHRGISLAVIVVFFYVLCFLTDLFLSCMFYGTDDFGGYIQTLQEYAKYPVPVSKGVYLCLATGKNCLALITLAWLAYMIFTLLRSRNLTVVLLVAVFVGEWQLFQRISASSNLRVLRYVNLMRVFDSTASDREYLNLNILGRAVSASLVLFWVEVLLMVFCFCTSVWLYGVQYPGGSSWFDRILVPVHRFAQMVLEKLSFGWKEVYKVLVSGRGVVFLFFGCVISVWIFQKTIVTFPETNQAMDQAYLTYGGEDWTDFDAYVEELREQRARALAESEEIAEQMRAGVLGPERMPEVSILLQRASDIQIYLREYEEKQLLRDAVREEQGIAIYVMSDRGYNEIIGSNSRLREMIIGIVLITVSVIFASHIFGIEKKSHMKALLKSSGRGITWLWRKKQFCCLCMVGMALCILYGGDLWGLLRRYQTPYMTAPIQSLTFYAESTARMSVLQLLLLNIFFRIILTFCAASAALWISSHRRTTNQMYVPLLIAAYSVINIIVLASGAVWLLSIATIVSLALTVFGVAGSYRNWCL